MVQIASNRIFKNSVERVLNPLRELADIDYFSYCSYNDEKCDLVCSDFDEIMDFGWSFIRPVSKGVLFSLTKMHDYIPNYGVVLIVFLVLGFVQLFNTAKLSAFLTSPFRVKLLLPNVAI